MKIYDLKSFVFVWFSPKRSLLMIWFKTIAAKKLNDNQKLNYQISCVIKCFWEFHAEPLNQHHDDDKTPKKNL